MRLMRLLERNENLSCIRKSKSKGLNFAKVNLSRTDFFIPMAKTTLTHLWKTFITCINSLAFWAKTWQIDILGFVISEILSQMVPGQSFSNHMAYRTSNSHKSNKFEKWKLIDFFWER